MLTAFKVESRKKFAAVTAVAVAAIGLTDASSAFAATTTSAMHSVSYLAEMPASNGQTTLVASNGAEFTVSQAVATTLNADRASAGLSTVPTVSPGDLGAVEHAAAATPLDTVVGDCGASSINVISDLSNGVSWLTSWTVDPFVVGVVVDFTWNVAGLNPNGTEWTHPFPSRPWIADSWTSSLFDHLAGKGKYILAVVPSGSFVIGSEAICYSGGPIQTATVG
ncbi:MAG: hypothetical protein M0T77_01180 [Actinomycetota bacterium]|nr:hypothetical protein [Actinomycetota bacterium]